MNLVCKSIKTLLKKPFIAVFFALIFSGILFCVNSSVSLFNTFDQGGESFGAVQAGAGTIDNIIGILVLAFNTILNPTILMWVIIGLIAFTIVGSGIMAIGISGSFNSISNELKSGTKQKNAFLFGLKKYFLKTWLINIIITLMFIAFIIIAILAVVPSLMHIQAGILGDMNNLWIGIGLAVLSAIVILYCLIYFLMYITFWYPALFAKNSTPFKTARGVVNENFFGIFLRLLMFVVVFICFEIIINYSAMFFGGSLSMVAFIIKLIAYTLLFSFGITYIFVIYDYLSVGQKSSIKID